MKVEPFAPSSDQELVREVWESLSETHTTPDNHKILYRLIRTVEARFSGAMAEQVKCVECDEPLDVRMSKRCVKHMAALIGIDYAKSKLREHGPVLMAKVAMGLQSWFEKMTSDDETKKEARHDAGDQH